MKRKEKTTELILNVNLDIKEQGLKLICSFFRKDVLIYCVIITPAYQNSDVWPHENWKQKATRKIEEIRFFCTE